MSTQTRYWGEKRYHSLDYELKKRFGEKTYKLSLNGGMTCPNRDGTVGDRGCIFCSRGGSGEFAADARLSIRDQIAAARGMMGKKFTGSSYIAYFQAYTNTYAPCGHLRRIFTEAISHPDVRALSIATRPDCLGEDVLALLESLNRIKPVWVELGLQTVHEDTAAYIRRGYALPVFERALKDLRARGIETIVHVILGLPGEDEERMLATVRYLARAGIQGIKLQLLHILEGTDLAAQYRREPFPLLTEEDYLRIVGRAVCLLNPDIVIHRLTGDGPRDLLIAPLWSIDKRQVLNHLHAYLKRQDLWQGKEYFDGNNSIATL